MKVMLRRLSVSLFVGLSLSLGLVFAASKFVHAQAPPLVNPNPGSVGIEGTIPKDPPQTGAIISIPTNGQVFTNTPITVSGICPNETLVKIFKNGAFAGAVQCENGSFSLQIDLFSGANELTARVFDDLDQEGPPSNVVTVTFNDTRPGVQPKISLTSNYAKRGANPGEKLTWPVILSGGTGPYAITVDWGDGKEPDLISITNPGVINLEHIYDSPGIYKIVVKATDKDGNAAFLQLVGIANGEPPTPGGDAETQEQGPLRIQTKLLLWPMFVLLPFIVTTFWLGKKYERKRIRDRMKAGLQP